MGGELDEVGDGDSVVVIDVAFLPGDVRAGRVEVGGEVDEVADGDDAVKIEIANSRGANQQVAVAVSVGELGDADAGVGM